MINRILNFVEVQRNQPNGVDGLNLPISVVISPDGKFLYVRSSDNLFTDSLNESAIAVFQLDQITGKLNFVEAQQDDIDNVDGLGGYPISISPDGNFLYVGGFDDQAIAIFSRDIATGKLILLDWSLDDSDNTLDGITSIAISPDSRFLYATTSDAETNALIVFERDIVTGTLNLFQFLEDDIDNIEGLSGAYSLAISNDGQFLYVTGIADAAVAVFQRDPNTQQLKFVEVQTGYTDSIDELFVPYSLVISPDNKYLYALGVGGVIGVFERNQSTGSLSLLEIQEEAATDTEGIAGVNAITISSDGRFLYAAILPNEIAVFRRNPTTGKLSLIEVEQDNTDNVDGLDGIFSLTTSRSSKFIYAAGLGDRAVAVFSQNSPPISANSNIYTHPNSVYNFQTTDFPFNDVDSNNSLQAVTIVSLPQAGELFLDSNNDNRPESEEIITNGQIIPTADLRQLKFKTDSTAIGNNYANFQFTVNDGAEDSAEAKTLTINVQGTVITKGKDDIFTIKNSDNNLPAKLEFKLTKFSPNIIYELGVFSVDDTEGKIDGLVPGTPDYTHAALTRAKIALFSISNPPNGFNPIERTRILEFNSGENFRFYAIPNSTSQAVSLEKTPLSAVKFIGNENIQVEEDGFSINIADLQLKLETTQKQLPIGVGLQASSEGELIDLQNIKQAVRADFIVNREASFDNLVGFYRVVDRNGGIDIDRDGKADILVGQTGYTQAALRGRVSDIDLRVNNQSTAMYSAILEAGFIYAPFIIVNYQSNRFLDENHNSYPEVYFPFLGANSDGTDHIHLLGDNTFGFEDLAYGGDQDYNDIVLSLKLTFL